MLSSAPLVFSVSPCLRGEMLGFCLFNFFRQRWDNIKQVSHHAVISNFKNRRFSILIDSDDRARALHSHNVLNGAADADSEIELGRNGLAGAADLPVHGKPAGVADGT